MNIQPKDTSKGHFRVSLAKSAVRIGRIGTGVALLFLGNTWLIVAGICIIFAEILVGIVEEPV
jgi:hypothetical protein